MMCGGEYHEGNEESLDPLVSVSPCERIGGSLAVI